MFFSLSDHRRIHSLVIFRNGNCRFRDIYFYGIDTNHNYIKDLDNTIALAKYSAKNKGRVIGLCCYCNQNPDYALALKWYEMAAKKGSKKAQDKIKEIQTGVKKKHKNFIIQTFEIQCNYY